MTRQGGPVVLLDQAVSPERRAELLEFFGEAFPFYDGPGGSRMALYEDRTRPGHFVELVLFEDEAAWRQSEARLETDPSMTTMLGRWRAHLARDPTVLQLVPVMVIRIFPEFNHALNLNSQA